MCATDKNKKPLAASIIKVKRIVGLDAPGEVCHVDINSGPTFRYWEGQSLGLIPPGLCPKSGKPNSVRLYSIASTRYGDTLDGNSVSLCVRRAVYWDKELGREDPAKKGVCSNFLCDAKPGTDLTVTGPTGKVMLMPEATPDKDLIMVATGTGIAPCTRESSRARRAHAAPPPPSPPPPCPRPKARHRVSTAAHGASGCLVRLADALAAYACPYPAADRGFLRRLFVETTPAASAFKGLAWLVLGVPTTPGLLYDDDWQSILKRNPDHFRLTYAISREQTTASGKKMYVQDRLAEYAEELFERLDSGAHIYFCGLKGMMPGATPRPAPRGGLLVGRWG